MGADRGQMLTHEDEIGPFAMAQYRALNGETEEAIRLLQRSLERTPPWFDFGLESELDSIRDVPRFVAILAEAKKRFARRTGAALRKWRTKR